MMVSGLGCLQAVCMKRKKIRSWVECFSFILWMMFTILSVSLTGLGLEGIVMASFMYMVSGTTVHFPLAMTAAGFLGMVLANYWRKVGVDRFNYRLYDSASTYMGDEESPSSILEEFIREVESCTGYERNDVRAKAKVWLISHASALDDDDILRAKAHFGYLLPAGWGHGKRE